MTNLLPGFFILAYIGFLLFLVVFLLTMLYRLVKAQETSSRHLLEIARDLKTFIKDQRKE